MVGQGGKGAEIDMQEEGGKGILEAILLLPVLNVSFMGCSEERKEEMGGKSIHIDKAGSSRMVTIASYYGYYLLGRQAECNSKSPPAKEILRQQDCPG